MSKRLGLLGVGVLVSIGLLVACGSNYNSSSDGLFLVGSQGSGVIETFSFNLNSGHVSPIANSPNDTAAKTCILKGLPSSLVMDPKGAYAYTIINANSACDTGTTKSTTGIQVSKVSSDGSVTAGSLVGLNAAGPSQVPVVPNTLAMDSAGKFLFVANHQTSDSSGVAVSGSISVFTIGSDGNLTEVAGSPFIPASTNSTLPDIVSVAVTPTVLPANGISGIQNAVCSSPGNTAPTSEFLYAVDTAGDQLFEFQVDTSSGVLTAMTGPNLLPPFATGVVPVGVAVDPCDRFVYVSNSQSNSVSAYTICNAVQPAAGCPVADGSLLPVSKSPFALTGNANGAGPLVVDPFGNSVYVLGTLSNTISLLRISAVSGSLTVSVTPIATGASPRSIAIRSDDTWLFVTNYGAATVSQYSITPATGVLDAKPAVTTDNNPWGVAVK
ncbi:MAG TPA: beta-propeller fold lactonase family protein [Candidatus Sulfotelmatobacter sp.]|nr:beta-propeller fold lactonase family protein [Candidatus Sulfotelmatobacter sp.]